MAAATPTIDMQDEQNFWPGYVDTLVNMVMFLILLIVILSMAVIFFSARARVDALYPKTGMTSEKPEVPTAQEEQYAAEKKAFPGTADKAPKQPSVEDINRTVEELKKKLFLAEQRHKPVLNPPQAKEEREVKEAKGEQNVEATLPQPPVGEARGVQEFSLRPTALIVRFRPGALDLNTEEADRLAQIFARHFDTANNKEQQFMLTAEAAEGLTESARMAFYRVAAVRNRLLGVAGVPRDRVQQRIHTVPSANIKGTEALDVRIMVIPVATEAASR